MFFALYLDFAIIDKQCAKTSLQKISAWRQENVSQNVSHDSRATRTHKGLAVIRVGRKS